MRCLALAQNWQDAGGQAIFAMVNCTSPLKERLRAEGFETAALDSKVGSAADAEETACQAHQRVASWIVVDGYEFGAEYQSILKSRGLKVLFLDDNGHAKHYSADIVLNQNIHASAALYSDREAWTRLLLGTQFSMLRRDFTAWRDWKRATPAKVRKVMLTMGGADPDNITARVLRVILSQFELEVTVVVGYNNPHLSELYGVAGKHSGTVRFVENATNMPELIASADVAVAAAGTTSLEMCFLGLPAILFVLADNQRAVAEELNRQGAAIHFVARANCADSELANCLRSLMASPEKRSAMSKIGRTLVDGLGASRVVEQLLAGAQQVDAQEKK
jgi:UDP-2,4-diacetamido-2,4,6-trideoxy-beta-L-altropyranose hydrolase